VIREWINTGIASIALLVSIASVFYSHNSNKLSNSALETAREANEIAVESNSIALGKRALFPIIDVEKDSRSDSNNENNYIDIKEYGSSKIRIINKGDVSISGVQIEVRTVESDTLCYPLDKPGKGVEALRKTHKFDFPQLLTKNAVVTFDISALVVSALKNSLYLFKQHESEYECLFIFIVYPIVKGEELPVESVHSEGKDRDYVNVLFTPNQIASINVKNRLQRTMDDINVYGGFSEPR
jgi:hypothetical protein